MLRRCNEEIISLQAITTTGESLVNDSSRSGKVCSERLGRFLNLNFERGMHAEIDSNLKLQVSSLVLQQRGDDNCSFHKSQVNCLRSWKFPQLSHPIFISLSMLFELEVKRSCQTKLGIIAKLVPLACNPLDSHLLPYCRKAFHITTLLSNERVCARTGKGPETNFPLSLALPIAVKLHFC